MSVLCCSLTAALLANEQFGFGVFFFVCLLFLLVKVTVIALGFCFYLVCFAPFMVAREAAAASQCWRTKKSWR